MVFIGFLDQKNLVVDVGAKNAPNPNIIHLKIVNKEKSINPKKWIDRIVFSDFFKLKISTDDKKIIFIMVR